MRGARAALELGGGGWGGGGGGLITLLCMHACVAQCTCGNRLAIGLARAARVEVKCTPSPSCPPAGGRRLRRAAVVGRVPRRLLDDARLLARGLAPQHGRRPARQPAHHVVHEHRQRRRRAVPAVGQLAVRGVWGRQRGRVAHARHLRFWGVCLDPEPGACAVVDTYGFGMCA